MHGGVANSDKGAAPRVGVLSSLATLRPYQFYVLGLLFLVIVCNYMDRGLLALLQEPMKHDLGLTDSQLGLLGGPAFALLYSLSGIPVARLAERLNRARLLAICVSFWSLMTAACGVAGNFMHLIAARMGVGAGEGGAIPISQSMLADTFSVRQRGMIMSVVSAATPTANILAPLFVPAIVHAWGWRAGFIVIGLPGVILALLVWLTLHEPRTDLAQPQDTRPRAGAFRADIGWLLRTPSYVFLFLGGASIGIGVTAIQLFKISFLMRVHGYSLTQAGAIWSVAGMLGLAGTFVGGYVSDRFADDRGRSYVLTPALGSFLTFTAFVLAFTVTSPVLAAGFLLFSQFAYNMKNGPIYAAVQNIVPKHMRATGAAVHMLAATVIGAMLGPTIAGALSDMFAASAFGTDAVAFKAACPGGRAIAGATLDAAKACTSAAATGLRLALLSTSFAFAAAVVFLTLAARGIRIASPDEPQAS